jgi:hypothetical protein
LDLHLGHCQPDPRHLRVQDGSRLCLHLPLRFALDLMVQRVLTRMRRGA